jgi:predicted XRE-type DNA-binding protein
MPAVNLKLSTQWDKALRAVAQQRSITIEELLLQCIANSYPPPQKKPQWFDDEAAARRAADLCTILDNAKSELIVALRRLEPPQQKGRTTEHQIKMARIWAIRRRTGQRLTQAMKARGLVQRDVAKAIGVSRSAVASAFLGRRSLPPTWHDSLIKLLGDDWMSE